MRIAIPWVILLCLPAIGLPLWLGIKDADFLTPPDEEALEAIRNEVQTTLPRLATQADVISPGGRGVSVIAAAPPLQLGNLSAPPALNEYHDRATRGAAHLIELANRLEDEGQPARALLAWERVIDQAAASQAEVRAAIEAIERLRPDQPRWNPGTTGPHPVVIQAGTGQQSAEALMPVLEQAAADLQRASGGLLAVTANVNAGPDIDREGPVPVAIWLVGGEDEGRSTDVRSFTVATPETLEHDTHLTLHLLIQNHLRNHPRVNRPLDPPDDGDPRRALATHLTRLQWDAFGESLNTPE